MHRCWTLNPVCCFCKSKEKHSAWRNWMTVHLLSTWQDPEELRIPSCSEREVVWHLSSCRGPSCCDPSCGCFGATKVTTMSAQALLHLWTHACLPVRCRRSLLLCCGGGYGERPSDHGGAAPKQQAGLQWHSMKGPHSCSIIADSNLKCDRLAQKRGEENLAKDTPSKKGWWPPLLPGAPSIPPDVLFFCASSQRLTTQARTLRVQIRFWMVLSKVCFPHHTCCTP